MNTDKKEVKKRDASKTGFHTALGRLPFSKFEKWFNENYTNGDAKAVYDRLNVELKNAEKPKSVKKSKKLN